MENNENRRRMIREIEDLLDDADIPTIQALIDFIKEIV